MTNKNTQKTHHIHIANGSGSEVLVPVRRRDGTEASMGSLATDKALRIAAFERHKGKRRDHATTGNIHTIPHTERSEDALSKRTVAEKLLDDDLEKQATEILNSAGYDETGQARAAAKDAEAVDTTGLTFQMQGQEMLDDNMAQWYLDTAWPENPTYVGEEGDEDPVEQPVPGVPAGVVLSTDDSAIEAERKRRKNAQKQIRHRGSTTNDDYEDEQPYYGEF